MSYYFTTISEDDDDLKNLLFVNVLQSNWEKVIEIYKRDPRAHRVRLTSQRQTALHIAVSDAKDDVVARLVEAAKTSSPSALKIADKGGQTALHLAAAAGNTRMCECIAKADSSLLTKRNEEGETPLFTAVLYGRRRAFLCLAELSKRDITLCRRPDDGKTILHVAILGQELELANDIIGLYKELANYIDKDGFSPLRTLASTPSCFKSGSIIERRQWVIYNSVWILVPILEMIIMWFSTRESSVGPSTQKPDIENPHNQARYEDEGWTQSGSRREKIKSGCLRCGKAICRFVDGFFGISMIREEEKKNGFAVKVADKLIKHSSLTVQSDHYHKVNKTLTKSWDSNFPRTFNDTPDDNNNNNNQEKIEKQEPIPQSSILIKSTARSGISDSLAELILENFPEAAVQDKGLLLSFTCLAPYAVGKKKQELVMESTILTAAKNGISEIVERILCRHPEAIHDMDQNRKNALLIAAENRNAEVFKVLIGKYPSAILGIQDLDCHRNTALHLAASYSGKVWPTLQGDVMQMLLEIKWYKMVEELVPSNYSRRPNNEGKTPREIFFETHNTLIRSSGAWLKNTSTASSVVATLIATVAFTSCTTFPGGNNGDDGVPNLRDQPLLNGFMVLSVIAFCCSIVSLVMFLSIFLGEHRLERGFAADVAQKLIIGLVSLFFAVTAIFSSFCTGQLFVLEGKFEYALLGVSVLTFLPILLFTVFQYPFFVDVVRATFWNPF